MHIPAPNKQFELLGNHANEEFRKNLAELAESNPQAFFEMLRDGVQFPSNTDDCHLAWNRKYWDGLHPTATGRRLEVTLVPQDGSKFAAVTFSLEVKS